MPNTDDIKKALEEINNELAALKEGSRAYKALLAERADLEATLTGAGAIAQGQNAQAVGQEGILVGKDVGGSVVKGEGNITNSTVIVAGDGARIVVGEQQVEMKAQLRKTTMGRYLEHVIAHNRYLQLQGIRSGGKLVNIELEQIYITLRTTRQRSIQAEEEWLQHEVEFAPGELRRNLGERTVTETVSVRVEQALAEHRHLVVLGDPGSGKTTLLRYLALIYGRDLAQGTKTVVEKLELEESGHLPILLHLRQMGQFLKAHRPQDDGTEGCALLLDVLYQSLKNHKLELPSNFFEEYLENGRVVVLLDGMDEVADAGLRARVARLVETFASSYPRCRFVVTSRVVGYTGAARLGGDFVTTTVRDFTMEDVRQFLTHWHRLIAIGLMEPGQAAETFAAGQTAQLLASIQANDRVRELAINPLMLTVIALVHRDRVKLPDRRAELYAEAVDVLLGKWDEARGVDEIRILEDRPFDPGDRRLLLQSIALYMQEREKKELEAAELRGFLKQVFVNMTGKESSARRAVERFLKVVEERTGLLAARGEGVYAFSHLTFQEYLAALALAARDDYIEYTLKHSSDAWWREVLLLVAGYLSTVSKEKTTRLIRAIAEHDQEPEPYYNIVLAADCLRDVGENRVEGALAEELVRKLRTDFTARPPEKFWGKLQLRLSQGLTPEDVTRRRVAAAAALAKIGSNKQTFWTLPFGEPDWVTIPVGEFWMGGDGASGEEPVHQVFLPEYQIARVSVTNAQYALFVNARKYRPPRDWDEDRPPKGKENHPVVYVNWFDANAYCDWLSEVTGKSICLPSEAEWEKAARGSQDRRAYPWGDDFDPLKCNSMALGLESTTPVGIFLEGSSPYGVLDLSGNVWEWTRSLYRPYPYQPADGRETLYTEEEYRKGVRKDKKGGDIIYCLRGGSFSFVADFARCAFRYWYLPDLRFDDLGFRVVLCSPFFSP